MGILSWIIVGLIAGWLTGLVMKGRSFGVFKNIIIGIVGGLLGGYLASNLLNISNPITGLNLTTILVAFLGSIALMVIVRLLRKL